MQAADGRIVYANRAAGRILRFDQVDEIRGRTSHDQRWQAVNEQMEPMAGKDHPAMVALRTGRPVHDFVQGLYADQPDGPVWLLVNSQPQLDDQGHVVEVVSTFLDITAQKQTERQLRESREQYHNLFEQMLDGFALHRMIFDKRGRAADTRFLAINPAFERLTGLRAEHVVGRRMREVLPEIDPQVIALFGQVARTGEPAAFDTHSTDLDRWYHATLYQPQPGQVAVMFEDITDRHLAEQHQQLMARELDHRVKNNLAVVLGLAQQAMHSAADYKTFTRQFTRQLQAMARAHEMLAAGHWESVDIAELVRSAVTPFDESHDRVHLQGKPIELHQGCVLPLMLSLHELATNAVKHGALSAPAGRVHVEWTATDGRLRLIWRELHGPPVTPRCTPGHGGRLMRGLIEQQLRGKLDVRFEPQGVVAVAQLPLHG